MPTFSWKINDRNHILALYSRRVDRKNENEVDICIFSKYDDAEIRKFVLISSIFFVTLFRSIFLNKILNSRYLL